MTKINRIVIHVCILFIRMRRFLFTLNEIDSICLVYSNFCMKFFLKPVNVSFRFVNSIILDCFPIKTVLHVPTILYIIEQYRECSICLYK